MDFNKFSTGRNPPQAYLPDGDEPYPSLSDNHDYEPNLEFDDSELHQSPGVVECTEDFIHIESNGVDSPVSDFEENFDELLSTNDGADFDDEFQSTSYPAVDASIPPQFTGISKYGIVDVKGDDSDGRKIIVVYACKLPPVKEIDHHHLLDYLRYTLEGYVKQDYSLIYFHYGLSSKNKPSIGWLVQAYKAFDRNYKKNLKALYIVHPTSFLKIVSQIFRPLISAKFGRKLNYINSLKELNELIPIQYLDIPNEVYDHERMQGLPIPIPEDIQIDSSVLPTQQFGVTLQYIKDNYNVTIPPIVKQCVEYLDRPDELKLFRLFQTHSGEVPLMYPYSLPELLSPLKPKLFMLALETEGIFRRSAGATRKRDLMNMANNGETLHFQDPHEAAVLLKKFLRELKEPLLTFELYDEIVQFQSWSKDEQLRQVSILVMEKLPVDNYQVLKYIISFLSRVMERSDLNKMNAQNLAVVFGPNLVWSELVSMSLSAIGPINMFTQFLLLRHEEIFMI